MQEKPRRFKCQKCMKETPEWHITCPSCGCRETMRHLKTTVSKTETVDHPQHYQGKTEVIDIIEQATEGIDGRVAFSLGNVIKYIMRHNKKGGTEDLRKAEWYLQRAIKITEGE